MVYSAELWMHCIFTNADEYPCRIRCRVREVRKASTPTSMIPRVRGCSRWLPIPSRCAFSSAQS